MECAASVVLGRPLSLRFQDIDVEASTLAPEGSSAIIRN